MRNRQVFNSLIISAFFGFVVLVVACGGGSDFGQGTVELTSPGMVIITSETAKEISSDSLQAGIFGARIADITGPGVFEFRQIPKENIRPSVFPKQGLEQFKHALSQALTGPIIVACAHMGDMRITGEMQYPTLALMPGDTLAFEYRDCEHRLGEIINGVMSVNVISLLGDMASGRFLLSLSVDVSSFHLDKDGHEYTAQGQFSTFTDSMGDPLIRTEVLGYSLSFEFDERRITMEDFSSLCIANEGVFPAAFTLKIAGMQSSAKPDSWATYETIRPLSWFGVSPPYDGETLITGGDNSSIRVTVLGVDSVLLEMDYDGDGAVDESTELTWDEAIG